MTNNIVVIKGKTALKYNMIDWLEENINPATLKEPMYVEGTGWSFKDRILHYFVKEYDVVIEDSDKREHFVNCWGK
jgi:hypothetical protein